MKLQGIIITSENPGQLIEFYQEVFQKDKPDWIGGEYAGFELENANLVVGPHSEVHGKNSQPGRIMVNLEVEDVEAEFERLVDLGAKPVAKPYKPAEEDQMWLSTLEDPDGNYIQLASPIILKN